MIKEVRIQNFQSHHSTTVTFSPTQTVIVGTSDSGKSAIIRAINWVRRNRPLGTSFITTGATSPCRVEIDLITPDGKEVTIEREKSSKTSFYKIGNEVYQALRSDVPEPVRDLLNLTDINVQLQLDQHFLVLETPGEIAKTINSITKIEEADRVQQRLAQKCREINSTIQASKERLEQLQALQKQYCYQTLGEFEELLSLLSDLRKQVEESQKRVTALQSLAEQVRSNASSVWNLNVVLSKMWQVDDLAIRFGDLSTGFSLLQKRYNSLSQIAVGISGYDFRLRQLEEKREIDEMVVTLLDTVPLIGEKVQSTKSRASTLGSLIACLRDSENTLKEISQRESVASRRVSALQPVEEIEQKVGPLKKKISDLDAVISRFKSQELQLSDVSQKEVESRKQMTEVLNQVEECPLCDCPLDDEHKTLVVERLSGW